MKLKRIIAATVGASLAFSTVFALSACNKDKYTGPVDLGTTTELDIDNYLTDYAEDNDTYSYDINVSVRRLSVDLSKVNTDRSADPLRVLQDTDSQENDIYSVFSIEHESTIVSGLTMLPSIWTWAGYKVVQADYPVTDATDFGYESAYIAADGTTLLPRDYYTYAHARATRLYIGNNKKSSDILAVVGEKPDGSVEKYYEIIESETDDKVTFRDVSASTLHTYNSAEWGVNVNLNDRLYFSVYANQEDYPVNGDIADYEYLKLGDTYTFYKDGQKTGSVEIASNGDKLGFVGDYMYYYTLTPVAADSTSYNYYDYEDEVKANYELYKYNIVANSTEKLDYNVMITGIKPLYNNVSDTYDAAAVSCCKMTDGVIYYGMSDLRVYVTDADLNVAYDISSLESIYTASAIYKLDDDRYSIGNYVVDSKLEFVGYVQGDKIYSEEKLMRFGINGFYGFADINGKIVIEPKYRSQPSSYNSGNFVFYNGVTAAYEFQDDGSLKLVLLKKDGTVTVLPSDTAVYDGFYIVNTSVDDNAADSKRSIIVYNFSGEAIKSFTDLTPSVAETFDIEEINGVYYLTLGNELYKVVRS